MSDMTITRLSKALAAVAVAALFTVNAQAKDWSHSVGTGFQFLFFEGDVGFDTVLGPIEVEVDLDPGDIIDYLDSALGVNGMSTNGDWTINYGLGYLKLSEGQSGAVGEDPIDVSLDLAYKMLSLDFSVSRNFYRSRNAALNFMVGGRWTQQDIDIDTVVGEQELTGGVKEDWFDGYAGFTHTYVLSPKVTWNSRATAGLGGSDFMYTITTGLGWRFANHWVAGIGYKVNSHDYESGSKGDPGWFKYDAVDHGATLTINYVW